MQARMGTLLHLLTEDSLSELDVKRQVEQVVRSLDFDFFFFAYRPMLPLSKARMKWLHNYPKPWCKRYVEQRYMTVDPRIIRARMTNQPFVWSKTMFSETPDLWEDLQEHGIRCGWTYTIRNGMNDVGVLSLSRTHNPLLQEELADKEPNMKKLALLCHELCAKTWRSEAIADFSRLTQRESEIMRWTADGKSSKDIAEILSISKNTVDFHIKNCVHKLNASNKTAAVTQATVLGMLS